MFKNIKERKKMQNRCMILRGGDSEGRANRKKKGKYF